MTRNPPLAITLLFGLIFALGALIKVNYDVNNFNESFVLIVIFFIVTLLITKKFPKYENWSYRTTNHRLIIVSFGSYLFFLVAGGASFFISLSILAGGFVFVRITVRILKEKYMLIAGLYYFDQLDGRQFEHAIAQLFRDLGYVANVTSYAGDFGADIIAKKDSKVTVIQAKRYSVDNKTGNVGIDAVQQVIGSIKHYRADLAMVITTSYYTAAAKKLAKSNNVILWDRDKLMKVKMEVDNRDNSKFKMLLQALRNLQLSECTLIIITALLLILLVTLPFINPPNTLPI